MRKPVTTFLMIAGCLCLSVIAGCATSRTAEQKAPATSAQTGIARADQPAVAEPTVQTVVSNNNASEGMSGSDGVADELHEPPKGSTERQALMDALREEYNAHRNSGRPFRGNITFVVNYLKVHNGWAWTYAEPHSSDPNDQFGENSGFLLHLEGGRWKVVKLPPMVDDPDDPENLDYPSRKDVAKIRKMYPSAPTDIFPSH
ncbi:MAG TPA: hypothetical protein VM095_10070 [Pyrinomonadaceae bacterium]|nr:hypothetical protein [Pyrinomonadaceae bacterium]